MTTLALPSISSRPQRSFSVKEFLRMGEAGILTKPDRVELIKGRIVERMVPGPEHVGTLQRVHQLLLRSCPDGWIVRQESPLKLPDSVLIPDAMMLRGPLEKYDHELPQAQDLVLVVEVSDSTLHDDQHEMASLYADAGIPFYWIINLVDRRVEIYSDPTGPDHFPAYKSRRDVNEAGIVSLSIAEGPNLEFLVKGMLATPKKS